MSFDYSENTVEDATQQILENLGWEVKTAWGNEVLENQTSKKDSKKVSLGRKDKTEVILKKFLLEALKKFNPNLPEIAYQKTLEEISQKSANKTTEQINKEKYQLFTEGIKVKFTNSKGELEEKRLKVFDFENPTNNYFLAIRQLEIKGDYYNRRPDVIGFVNGIPLVFMELKAHHQNLKNAFTENFTDYKDTISHIFHTNAFVILSNGTEAKIGTITSPYEFFSEWKRISENEVGIVSLETILKGTCEKKNLMDLLENFILFDSSSESLRKIIAKNHQFLGVNEVVSRAKNIDDLEGKLGVFWHTQGSGKSFSMVFLSQKIHRKFKGSYTFLLVVDRTELETQLYETFSGVGAVTEENVKAKNREHLRELLKENHRFVFTLIHKFSTGETKRKKELVKKLETEKDPEIRKELEAEIGIEKAKETEFPLITDRKNIIVISDEAHRTQDGNFAENMRYYGIPNASYIGFTGTPIIKEEDELTKRIFGKYVSVYNFNKAIDDGATLSLRYLNRGEKLKIQNPKLNERMSEIINDEDLDEDQRKKLEREFNRDYPVLTSDKRLNAIAKDVVWHFHERGYQGKAMFVAIDKPTAVKIYDLIQKHLPNYKAELLERINSSEDETEKETLKLKLAEVEKTEVCVVVSSEQNEVEKFRKLGLEILPHRKKMSERDLEKEFKDNENPFRLVIVCAMWITGFDAPCVSTVYLDKPIKGHTLMQTIARANRVFDDEKECGLIIDYGNVYLQLQKAYSIYGDGKEKDENEIDTPVKNLEELAEELGKAIEETENYLLELGFRLELLVREKDLVKRLARLDEASNCVCLNPKKRTKFEILAREVFKKYKALFPDELARPFLKDYNGIEAIYSKLNQRTKSADISEVIVKLQKEVDSSILVVDLEKSKDEDYIDLNELDCEKLKKAFEKMPNQNSAVFDLQEAIDRKLKMMLKQNPLRTDFYERYQKIIEDYNNAKDYQEIKKIFDEMVDFVSDLSEEDSRKYREGLDEETLAIFDLVKKDSLTKKEEEKVKEVAKQTLEKLKEEKLKIERWRESSQVVNSVKILIKNNLEWLPKIPYSDKEVAEKAEVVFFHIHKNYFGNGESVYTQNAA